MESIRIFHQWFFEWEFAKTSNVFWENFPVEKAFLQHSLATSAMAKHHKHKNYV